MHNLEIIDGQASFASTQVEWHGLGTVLDNPMTAEQAMKEARLDYFVDKVPTFMEFNDKRVETGMYSTVRTDTGQLLGNVGGRYTVLQNREAFDFFDFFVEKGSAIYETAGVLGQGETIFLSAKLPSNIVIGNDDVTELYIVLSNTHDGSRAVEGIITPIRVCCNNTLAMSRNTNKAKIHIRHTKNVYEAIKKAGSMFEMIADMRDELEYNHKLMLQTVVTDEEAKEIFAKYLGTSEENKMLGEYPLDEVFSTRKKNLLDEVVDFYHTGIGQQGTVGTMWGVYNALTGYETHLRDYRNGDSARFQGLILDGASQKALDLVMREMSVK